jgi:hypothetical protein
VNGKRVIVCVTLGILGALLGCSSMNTQPAPTATPGVGFRQSNLVADVAVVTLPVLP